MPESMLWVSDVDDDRCGMALMVMAGWLGQYALIRLTIFRSPQDGGGRRVGGIGRSHSLGGGALVQCIRLFNMSACFCKLRNTQPTHTLTHTESYIHNTMGTIIIVQPSERMNILFDSGSIGRLYGTQAASSKRVCFVQ